MIVYGSSLSPFVRKVLAFAAEKGIELEVKPTGLATASRPSAVATAVENRRDDLPHCFTVDTRCPSMASEVRKLNGLAQPFGQSRCSSRPYSTSPDLRRSPPPAEGCHNRRRVPIQKPPAAVGPGAVARQPGTSRTPPGRFLACGTYLSRHCSW